MPSLVIDVLTLQKRISGSANQKELLWKPPSFQLSSLTHDTHSNHDSILDPIPTVDHVWNGSPTTIESASSPLLKGEGICYLHTRVTRAREDVRSDDKNPDTFLAELDLLPSHIMRSSNSNLHLESSKCLHPPPTLVLGLNNHHVISYYWARSAGAGAAMEAPGILYHPNGELRWKSQRRSDDNTNDGKRSEWVNFLRVGDAVQLVPHSTSIPELLVAMGTAGRVYGISSAGRPLGSEPGVVCHWQLRDM